MQRCFCPPQPPPHHDDSEHVMEDMDCISPDYLPAIKCYVLTADPSPEEIEQYVGKLEAPSKSEPRLNEKQFRRSLDELDTHCNTIRGGHQQRQSSHQPIRISPISMNNAGEDGPPHRYSNLVV